MKTRSFLAPLLVAAGLVCATGFQAIAGGGGGGGGGGRGGGGGFGGGLTPEQATQIRDAMQGSTDMSALTNKLAAAQKDAINAALAKDATDASVRTKIEAVAKIQTDIAVLRYSKGVKAVVPSVTDDQKTTMNTTPGPAYNALFGGAGGAGGGRGGRGGRGGAGGGGGGGN